MFDRNSRYARIEQATWTAPDGQQVAYARRRFPPSSDQLNGLEDMEVRSGERLDQLAERVLGGPEQFWRLCDSNDVLSPSELTQESVRVVKVARLDDGSGKR